MPDRNEEKLGVLFAGLGSVTSTLLAGIEAIKRGYAAPVGSQALSGQISHQGSNHLIKDLLSLTELPDMVFGGWDIHAGSCYEAACKARVLDAPLLEKLRGPLEAIKPFPAVVESSLPGMHAKQDIGKRESLEALRRDIRAFRKANGAARVVVVICNSTEPFHEGLLPRAWADFEAALDRNEGWIRPSVLYAAAAVLEGVACVNATPSIGFDVPALIARAKEDGVPLAGKDLKTGQTFLKTLLAPGLKMRMLGLAGWYSTNILGNGDGEVLDDPRSNKTKVSSKESVLSTILDPEVYPDLYSRYNHKVRIDYYPPRGDNKEAWDNIDIFGWMGYPMQIKVNFLCRDSILAAPLVLDLILFTDLASRRGRGGLQDWLSLYHKSPSVDAAQPVHDVFEQFLMFRKALAAFATQAQPAQAQPRLAAPPLPEGIPQEV